MTHVTRQIDRLFSDLNSKFNQLEKHSTIADKAMEDLVTKYWRQQSKEKRRMMMREHLRKKISDDRFEETENSKASSSNKQWHRLYNADFRQRISPLTQVLEKQKNELAEELINAKLGLECQQCEQNNRFTPFGVDKIELGLRLTPSLKAYLPGCEVVQIVPGGLAENAGILKGDVISAVGAERTCDLEAFKFAVHMHTLEVRKVPLVLQVWRSSRNMFLNIKIN